MMDGFSARISSLSPGQKASLMERLKNSAGRLASYRIKPRPKGTDRCPLSFAQQRLWFLHQLELGGLAYNLPFALRLTGPLDVVRLEKCINKIICRHEILRTTFTEIEGQPAQIIAPRLTLSVPVIDLRELSEKEREAEARRLVSFDAWRTFDLAHGPLLSFTVLRLKEQEYVWMLAMHHIITDGWSIGLFVRELTILYEAFSRGLTPELPDLPVQYADFALWQRQWLQGEAMEKGLAIWKEELAGAPHRLELPTDYPRPAVRNFKGARESFTLPPEETKALKELSRAEGATLFMALLSVYKLLLYYLTRSHDILIGCLIANRNHLETENLIGFFVNQLVLRARFAGDPSFRELLGRVRLGALSAFDHQEIPYQWLVDALRVERDLSRNPLFQANFTFQNTPITALKIGDLTIAGLAPADESLPLDVDLSLLISESPQGLYFVMRYRTDLFTPATVKQMLREIETIIRQALARPATRLSEFVNAIAEADSRYLETRLKQRKSHNLGKLEEIRSRRRGK